MCLKRSYEKPNSKTFKCEYQQMQNIFNIVTKSNGMHKDIKGGKIQCYHLATNISSSVLSKIIR